MQKHNDYTYIRSFYNKGRIFWHVISNVNENITYCIDCFSWSVLFSVDIGDYSLRDSDNNVMGHFDTKLLSPEDVISSWIFVDNNGEVTYNTQHDKQSLSKFEVEIFKKFI